MGKCTGKIVDCDGPYDCYDPSDDECYKTVSNVKPKPVPDNNKKKKEEKKVTPKTECTSDYGSPLSNSQFGEDLKTAAGLKLFKEFLKKYYSENVDKYGGSALVDGATINDCILIKLFNSSEAKKNNRIIGVYVYPDWKTFTGGNVTSKTTEEFQSWLGSSSSSDKEDFIPTTNDWQKLIDNGQISVKGKKITFDNKPVMLFKFKIKNGDTTGGLTSILPFDENELDGDNLSLTKLLKNITYTTSTFDGGYPEIFYAFYTFPVKNDDTETNEKYPLKVKRYVLVKGKDVNGDERLEAPESLMVYRGIKAPKKEIKINESFIKKFILEKIKEKNDKNYYPVVTEVTTGIGGDDEEEDRGNLGDGGNKDDNDSFGINNDPNLQTSVAKQSWMNKKVALIQDLINKGAKSNFFVAWNDLANAVKATKLNLPKSTTPITKDNSFNVGEPKSDMIPQYQKEPFYQILGLAGDPNKNKATIYQPVGVTDTQKLISASSSPQWCRSKLLNYLKVGLSQKFMSTVGNEPADYKAWKLKREICDCNSNGAFENFKTRGKDVDKDFVKRDKLKKDEFTTINKDQQTLVYDPTTDSYVNKTSTNVDKLSRDVSPFVIFNKKLNWREIVSLLNGNFYTSKGGLKNTIDPKLIISGFDKGIGSTCLNDSWRNEYAYKEEGTVQKESLDNRIEKKLSETIKSKNKKETLVENVLKKLLKDKL